MSDKVDKADREKIAFTSHYGLYQLTRMLFDLKYALETFQRVIGIILSSIKWQFALVYLLDIFMVSKTPREYKAYTKMDLTLLNKIGVEL